MQEVQERNEIFISLKYNGGLDDSIIKFKEELERYYLFQLKTVTLPAYSEGGESWFTIFINSNFFEFAKEVVVYGMAWDLLKKGGKKYFLRPLIIALNKLDEEIKNSEPLLIEKMTFQFDDVNIVIGGLTIGRMHVVGQIFMELMSRKDKIESLIGLPLDKIETPLHHNPGIDKRGYSPYILQTFPDGIESLNEYFSMWKVWSMSERDCHIYKLQEDIVLDAYPNK